MLSCQHVSQPVLMCAGEHVTFTGTGACILDHKALTAEFLRDGFCSPTATTSAFVAGSLLPWAAFFHLMFSVWAFSWAKWPQEKQSKLADSIFGIYVRKVGKCCFQSFGTRVDPGCLLLSAWAPS